MGGRRGKSGGKGEFFSGTTIKDPSTTPKWGRIKAGRWKWLGWGTPEGGNGCNGT